MNEHAVDLYRLIQELYLMLDDGDRRLLREYDLTNRQYHALQLLAPGLSRHLTEMSELLFCDKSNVTGLVERMVRDGLVTRERAADDRRYLRLALTEAGNTLRERSREAHRASIRQRFEALTLSEQQQLYTLLARLAGGVRDELEDSG